MEIEKAIAALVENQLRADRRADRADRRLDRLEKQVSVTAALVKEGIPLVRVLQKSQQETDYRLNALIEAQMRSERRLAKLEEASRKNEERFAKNDEKFNRLVDLIRRRSNGHS